MRIQESSKTYEERIEWYRKRMIQLRESYDTLCRRDQEYCRYLERWFSDGRCDGVLDYETRILWKTTPMPYNIYFS